MEIVACHFHYGVFSARIKMQTLAAGAVDSAQAVRRRDLDSMPFQAWKDRLRRRRLGSCALMRELPAGGRAPSSGQGPSEAERGVPVPSHCCFWPRALLHAAHFGDPALMRAS